jgi:hypothetical protein
MTLQTDKPAAYPYIMTLPYISVWCSSASTPLTNPRANSLVVYKELNTWVAIVNPQLENKSKRIQTQLNLGRPGI